MRVRWGLCGLMLWGVGTATALLLHSEGVRQETVCLSLSDGTPIHGVLYRPTDSPPEYPMPAAVVLHGLATSHRSCEVALAKPLVRSGFVVLAIDMRGHARSGGSLPQSWFDDLDRILEQRVEHPEVTVALQYLRALPDVDAQKICLLGHSLGGLAAVNAACSGEPVASVVAISVAPQMCDLENPRNLLLLAGDLDRLISPPRFQRALSRATGGRLDECSIPFGRFKKGTARELWVAHWVSHLSPLFDPCASRRAVLWATLSVGREPGFIPCKRLIAIDCLVLVSLLAGGVATAVFLSKGRQFLLSAPSENHDLRPRLTLPHGALRRSAIALALCGLAVPVAAFLGDLMPNLGVLFAGASLALCALLALAWMAAAGTIALNEGSRAAFEMIHVRGAALGILGAVAGGMWLGVPLGSTWMDLVPCSQRIVLGSLLLVLLLPWSLVLARGVQRTVPNEGKRSALYRGLIWLAIAGVVWLGNELFNRLHPFFGISVSLLGAAFILPLPLWLLKDRPGMTAARAVCQAASAAWLLACHLPFVHNG